MWSFDFTLWYSLSKDDYDDYDGLEIWIQRLKIGFLGTESRPYMDKCLYMHIGASKVFCLQDYASSISSY